MLAELNLFQFKRFDNETIELYPLTLLTGINGMGKSTVVQSLLTLRQSFDKGELLQRSNLVIEDQELVNLISPDDMLSSSAKDKTVAITLTDDNAGRCRWSVQAEGASNTLPAKKDEVDGDIFKSNLFDERFQYLSAERIGPRLSYDRLSIKRYHSPLGVQGEFAPDKLLEILTSGEKTNLTTEDEKEPRLIYDAVNYWIGEIIYPGTKVTPNDAKAKQVSLSYSFPDDKFKVYNPLNVGFGFSYALPVILAVLIAKPGSLLIVENPEAHLHPKGQSAMGMLLALAADNDIQVIMETHSDHVLNGIRMIAKGGTPYGRVDPELVKIHFFHPVQKNDKGTDTRKRSIGLLDGGKLTGWPKNFFDEWENNLRFLIK